MTTLIDCFYARQKQDDVKKKPRALALALLLALDAFPLLLLASLLVRDEARDAPHQTDIAQLLVVSSLLSATSRFTPTTRLLNHISSSPIVFLSLPK